MPLERAPPIHLQIHLQSIREVCRTVLLETLCVWLFIDVRCKRGAIRPSHGEESSIAERRALLQKGKLYCKEESSVVEHSIAENI